MGLIFGSLGNLSVADAWAAGAGDMLCSDYHYPSLLQAPFHLHSRGLGGLSRCWDAVSATPAAAARLPDRGHLTPGALADLVVIEPAGANPAHQPARCVAALVGGELAWHAP